MRADGERTKGLWFCRCSMIAVLFTYIFCEDQLLFMCFDCYRAFDQKDYQIMLKLLTIGLLSLLLVLGLSIEVPRYKIDLDIPTQSRYTEVALKYKKKIVKAIDFLKTTIFKYKISFQTAYGLQWFAPKSLWFKHFGKQFYYQALSISKAIQRPISQVIVMSFTYDLADYDDFCTAIATSTRNKVGFIEHAVLARNVDYIYKNFMGQLAVILEHYTQKKLKFTTIGEMVSLGVHTVLRHKLEDKQLQYSITLNQRSDKGRLHQYAWQMGTGCISPSYLIVAAAKLSIESYDELIKYLIEAKTCSTAFFIITTSLGDTGIVVKNFGKGAHTVYQPRKLMTQEGELVKYLIQTNWDEDDPDHEDGRKMVAYFRVEKLTKQKKPIDKKHVWALLTKAPIFRDMTTITVLVDVLNATVHADFWF